ncbi:MAG: NUDIX domain-containing protein [Candidatus Aenigmatarchaeota archaeon]
MKKSAGVLVYRKKNNKIEILLVHPGGPFWQNKDENSWSIPKGEIEDEDINLKETAIREFEEETGLKINEEDKEKMFYLGEVKSTNKILYVFILEKDFGDDFEIKSNLIEIEWPPKSGKFIKIPEVDKAGYFDLETAKIKLVNYQKEIVEIISKIIK